jgi:hypothetical protein
MDCRKIEAAGVGGLVLLRRSARFVEVRCGSKAVLCAFLSDVRLTPTNRHQRARASGPKSVKSGPWRVLERCPLYPDEQTSASASIRSEKCHMRTLAVQPVTKELDGELPVRRRRSLLAIRRAPLPPRARTYADQLVEDSREVALIAEAARQGHIR